MSVVAQQQHSVPENLKTANGVAEWEIADQMTNGSALDARLLGLLAATVAVGGLLLTLTNGLASNRWMLFVASASSAVWLLLGLLILPDLDSGPSAASFYAAHGRKSQIEFDAQLLADFGDTVRKNKDWLRLRRAFFTSTILWTGLWTAAFGIVRALS